MAACGIYYPSCLENFRRKITRTSSLGLTTGNETSEIQNFKTQKPRTTDCVQQRNYYNGRKNIGEIALYNTSIPLVPITY